jgi:predicted amidohydrolase
MRIGVAQIRSLDTIEANTASILAFVDEARRLGVRILGFPETALTGYLLDGFPSVDAGKLDGAVGQIAARLRGGSLAVVVGTPTKEGGTLRNSAIVLFPDGRRLVYHKMNLPSNENVWFTPGNATLSFEVEQRKFGVAICRDQNAPELAGGLARAGVRGLFLCSAHYYEPVESRMKLEKNVAVPIARAYENGIYLFKANAVGSNRGMVSYGTSMIIDPRGIVVQKAGETREEMLFHDIDLARENPRW